MNRRMMLKEGLITLGQSLPRVLGVLAGAGLLRSPLGGRRGKKLRVNICGALPPPSAIKKPEGHKEDR